MSLIVDSAAPSVCPSWCTEDHAQNGDRHASAPFDVPGTCAWLSAGDGDTVVYLDSPVGTSEGLSLDEAEALGHFLVAAVKAASGSA